MCYSLVSFTKLFSLTNEMLSMRFYPIGKPRKVWPRDWACLAE